jgi:hypothetical protein
MAAIPADVAAALNRVPAVARQTIKASLAMSCEGDWRRVTVEGRGFKVHNTPQTREVAVKKAPAKKTETKTHVVLEREAPAPEPRLTPTSFAKFVGTGVMAREPDRVHRSPVPAPPSPVDAEALAKALRPLQEGVTPSQTIEPGVNVELAGERPYKGPEKVLSPERAPEDPWATDELILAEAASFFKMFRNGLPEAIRFDYFPEVLAVDGLNLDDVEAAVRHPEDVEIAREHALGNRYPILRFRRGDVVTVMGFRTPRRPRIIAGYWIGLLLHDTHRVSYAGITGGGGARKEVGLPNTPRQAINRLKGIGADITWEETMTDVKAVEVKYHGQSLGKISVDPTTKRDMVKSQYQSFHRKMHAIQLREQKAG